jgi:hypothetical protein
VALPGQVARGEPLQEAEVRLDGIRGDRLVHVEGPRGLITARTHPGLLGLTARLDGDDVARVEGLPWWHDHAGGAVRGAAGADAVLVPHDGPDRFDILPLLVATDGAIAAFAQDGRRLRPEHRPGRRRWPRRARVGGQAPRHRPLVVLLHSLRARCIVTTYDPDTLAQDVDVLRDIRRRFGGTLALNSAVLHPGTIRVGDPARIVDAPAGPDASGPGGPLRPRHGRAGGPGPRAHAAAAAAPTCSASGRSRRGGQRDGEVHGRQDRRDEEPALEAAFDALFGGLTVRELRDLLARGLQPMIAAAAPASA